MSRRKKNLKLKPSYTTRLHLKRRLHATDWRFLLAIAGLAGATVAVTSFFS
jgi:hypothetical protein